MDADSIKMIVDTLTAFSNIFGGAGTFIKGIGFFS